MGMEEVLERVGPERAWLATVVTLIGAIAVLVAVFPQRLYVEIIWQYFWGPVLADAHGWSCIAWDGGAAVRCSASTTGPTAAPGYTVVSYAGYIPTLVLLLTGIYLLIRRFDLRPFRDGFYALVPFMFFGGALRVVEDANVAAFRATGQHPIDVPYSGLLISPVIYVVVFLIALAAVVVSLWLERRGTVSRYATPLAAIGTALLVITLGYLGVQAWTTEYVSVFPSLLVVVLVGATLATAVTWGAIERFAPAINAGTGLAGLVVIWAHALDGTANVIGLDWATTFGLPYNLTPKHPLNAAIVDLTASLLPASIVEVTGAAWPFLLLKLAAATGLLWVFDESIFEDSPRFAYLLLITVVAVGLGPGTRDVLRATFGV